MNSNDHIFAQPPPEIAKALGWRTAPSAEEIDEAAAVDLFSRVTAIQNPWLVKEGQDGVMKYGGNDEALAEQEYASGVEPMTKLFTPKEPAGKTPALCDLPVQPREDDDEERELYSPVRKLFYPGISTTTSRPADENRFAFSKRAAAPAKKESRPLTYKTIVIGEDTWSEGRDENDEVQSMMLVLDETEE